MEKAAYEKLKQLHQQIMAIAKEQKLDIFINAYGTESHVFGAIDTDKESLDYFDLVEG